MTDLLLLFALMRSFTLIDRKYKTQIHTHTTRPVQFIMQFRSMQYRYSYIKNKAIGKQVQYLCYP